MATSLYHSKLVPMGQVWAQITSDVIPSKFQGKPPFCAMIINGVEYSYSCENQACEEALKGYKGHQILIEAQGSREQATINVLQTADGGAPPQAPAAPPARPVPQRAPAPSKPVASRTATQGNRGGAPAPAAPPRPQPKSQDEALNDAAAYVARCGVLMQLCHKAAVQCFREYMAEFGTEIDKGAVPRMEMEQVQAVASSLFIGAHRAGHADALPTVLPPAQEEDNVPM